jgi:hypothetical protein
MRHFLSSSRLNDERDDAAAARRDRALHAWRNLGSPPSVSRGSGSRGSFSRPNPPPATNVLAASFLRPGDKAEDVLKNAMSAIVTAQATASAEAAAGSPTLSRPVPTFLAPLPPQGSFNPTLHSTPDPALSEWYRKAAAAREARRPVYRATTVRSDPPSAELAALAEKFRTAAARASVSVGAAKSPGQSESAEDSYTTANLSNNSILESDFHDNSSILTPVTVNPPLPPPPPHPCLCHSLNGYGKLVS